MSIIKELVEAKREYDKIAPALAAAKETGLRRGGAFHRRYGAGGAGNGASGRQIRRKAEGECTQPAPDTGGCKNRGKPGGGQ